MILSTTPPNAKDDHTMENNTAEAMTNNEMKGVHNEMREESLYISRGCAWFAESRSTQPTPPVNNSFFTRK